MSSKSQRYNSMMAKLDALYAQAAQPSPYENDLSQKYGANRQWLLNGNLKNTLPGNVVNLAPVADERRMAAYGNGDSYAAGANPTAAIATGQSLANDAATREVGGAYEQNAQNVMGETGGMQSALNGLYANRNALGVQGAAQHIVNYNNRPRSWLYNHLGQLIGIGSQVGLTAATGGFSGKK